MKNKFAFILIIVFLCCSYRFSLIKKNTLSCELDSRYACKEERKKKR